MISSESDRHEHRKRIGAFRRTLSSEIQTQAANELFTLASQQNFFINAQTISFYMPHRGEISPALLMSQARQNQKNTCLPILNPCQHNSLLFLPVSEKIPLVKNRYGIEEVPFDDSLVIFPWQLDLVFVPLVAFDAQGHRLGMGAGYYDRTFAFIQTLHPKRPVLCGLGYEFQKIDTVSPMPWDIPLDWVITEKQVYNTET